MKKKSHRRHFSFVWFIRTNINKKQIKKETSWNKAQAHQLTVLLVRPQWTENCKNEIMRLINNSQSATPHFSYTENKYSTYKYIWKLDRGHEAVLSYRCHQKSTNLTHVCILCQTLVPTGYYFSFLWGKKKKRRMSPYFQQ